MKNNRLSKRNEYSIKSYIKEPTQVVEAASTVDELLVRYSDMPGDPNSWVGNKVKKLDTIIAALRSNAYAPELKIFGDAARQDDTVPDDIAIFIDLNKIRLDKHIMRTALNEILALGARYRGMLIPYILINNSLWTKDADSTTWIKSPKSDIVTKGRQGLPITLYDRSFGKIGYAGLSENKQHSKIKSSILDWVKTVENTVIENTVEFDGQQIPRTLAETHSRVEIAAILGGH
jgi:hypothetical protein